MDPLLRRIANRSSTFAERLASPDTDHPGPDLLDGAAVMAAWRQALAVPDDRAFASRLAWLGLTRTSAEAAAARVPWRTGPLPAWVGWIREALCEGPAVADAVTTGALDDLPRFDDRDEPPFVELATAWLRVARRALNVRDDAALPIPVARIFEAQLLREWALYAGPALLEAFRACRDQGPEAGPASYTAFVVRLLRGDAAQFFEARPVLARLLALVCQTWVDTTREFTTRLAVDAPALARVFNDGQPTGPVVRVEPALSDPHDGRRRVVAMQFESGVRVVYKPRDLSVDAAFADLLAWAEAAGLSVPQRRLAVLTREGYGWVEYAEAADTWTDAEAANYFERAGGLLCWTHVLRGRDLHRENVVATANGPVIVDLEVLLQPVRRGAAAPDDAGGAGSCLETGLVSMIETRADGEVIDVGGFRGTPEDVASQTTKSWRHVRTPAIALVDEPAPAVAAGNGVRVNGRRVDPGAYADAFTRGFAATYRFLRDHRDHLLALDGPLRPMAASPVRVLARPTEVYGQIVRALAAPRYQTDGAVRSVSLEILGRPWVGHAAPPATWPVIEAEQRCLDGLDVPRFWVRADGDAVHEGSRAIGGDLIVVPGWTAVRQQVDALSEEDLARQLADVREALESPVSARFAVPFSESNPSAPDGAGDSPLIRAALTMAHELLARRGAAPGGRLREYALYAGAAGLPVFLAALARVTDEPRWVERAREAAAPVLDYAAQAPWSDEDAVGACAGWGSLVYAGVVLARLLPSEHRDVALAAATAAARHLRPDRASPAIVADVTDGWAGAVLALVALASETGDRAFLDLADACAERIAGTAVETPEGPAWLLGEDRWFVGFAHGCAGIATALAVLAQATSSRRWTRLAQQSWRTVERSFQPQAGGWPVEPARVRPQTPMKAWCHGTPGVLLGLARTLDFGHERAILTHADTALTTLQHADDHREDHVCCGNLGRADALLTWGARVGREEAVQAARTLGRRVVERAARRGHVRLCATGFVYRVFHPGFFRGLSGVGYQLVRLAAPARVPSVLGFD